MSERRYKPFQGRFAVYGPVHPIDGGDYAPLAVYAEESDARLSAAAPELLEACRTALDGLLPCNPQDPELVYSGDEMCPKEHPNCCGNCGIRYQVMSAISKAEGQS